MLLAIDTGNTNTVFAVFDDDGGMLGEWRSSTNANRTADEIGVWLSQLFALESIEPRRTSPAASSPRWCRRRLFSLRRMFRRYFDCHAAGRRRAGRGHRHRRSDRPAGGGRRRPSGQCRRRLSGVRRTEDHRRLRHRHDLRRDRRRRQLPRRRHRAGRQSVAGGAAPGIGAVAARRDRPARAGGRQDHRAGDALRASSGATSA